MLMGVSLLLLVGAACAVTGIEYTGTTRHWQIRGPKQQVVSHRNHKASVGPRREYRQLRSVLYPHGLREGDGAASLGDLRRYGGDEAPASNYFEEPFSPYERICTVRIPTYTYHHGKCVPLGRRGLSGCQTDLHIVPNHSDCRNYKPVLEEPITSRPEEYAGAPAPSVPPHLP